MRTLTRAEICRDLAYSILRIRRNNSDIAAFFETDAKIVIYGAGAIGRQICDLLFDQGRTVSCFIDKSYSDSYYSGVPIYHIDSSQLIKILENEKTVVVVTPIYNWDLIMKTMPKSANARWVPVNVLFAFSEKEVTLATLGRSCEALVNKILDMDISSISNIIVTQTPYNLLLCLLVNSNWNKAFFVFGKPMPNSFLENLKKMNLPVMKVRANDMDEQNQVLVEFLRLVGFLVAISGTRVWGLDHVFPGKILFGGDFYVVEDGDFNYDPVFCHQNSFDCEDYPNEQLLRNDCCRRYVVGGFDEAVKKVFLTRENDMQKVLVNKANIIDVHAEWEEKSKEQKKDILKVFGIDDDLQMVLHELQDCIVFLTRTYADDGVMTREEMIELYKRVLDRYRSEKVVIKPHPRDNSDYSKYFHEYILLPQYVPVEILGMLGTKIKTMIGFGSTAFSYGEKIGANIHEYNIDGERLYEY